MELVAGAASSQHSQKEVFGSTIQEGSGKPDNSSGMPSDNVWWTQPHGKHWEIRPDHEKQKSKVVAAGKCRLGAARSRRKAK